MGTPDPRKQKLVRLATRLASACLLDLLLLGIYFILFDWFASTYLLMHEWQSLLKSLNKVLDWKRVVWTGSTGIVFISSTVCAGLTLYDTQFFLSNCVTIRKLALED